MLRLFIWIGFLFVLGGVQLPAAAQDAQDLQEKARIAAEAARKAMEAADIATKAAKAAKDAADAASAAASAARGTAAHTSVPATEQAASVAAPTQKGAGKKVPGAELSTYLTASSEGGNATLKLAHRVESPVGDLLYSLALSSPLSKDSTFTEPATLDGLANGANISFSLGRYILINREDEDTGVWSVGGLVRAGYTSFKYFEPTNLTKTTDRLHPSTVGAYAGLRPSGVVPVFFLAKFEYQHTWKDADAKVLCPSPTATPVTCVNGPIGAPVESRKQLWSLSARYTNPLFDIAPTIVYDNKSKVKGIDIPFYFIKGGADAKNTLPFNAGLRFGWRSDTKDPTVGIFVGSPFSLYTP